MQIEILEQEGRGARVAGRNTRDFDHHFGHLADTFSANDHPFVPRGGGRHFGRLYLSEAMVV